MSLPVSHGKVLLLFQGMDESDQEVFVVEKRGEHSDALLDVRPCCVGCLKTAKVEKTALNLQGFTSQVQRTPAAQPPSPLCPSITALASDQSGPSLYDSPLSLQCFCLPLWYLTVCNCR